MTLPLKIDVVTFDEEITEHTMKLKGVYYWDSGESDIYSPECGFLISHTAATLEDLKATGDRINCGYSSNFTSEITIFSDYYYVAWCKLSGKSFFGEVKSTATP